MGSYKNVLKSYQAVTSGSMAADVTSASVNIEYLDNVGVQLVWTGTATGNFFVDVSIDGGTTWTALTLSPAPTAAGASSDYYIDLNQLSAPLMRVRYVRTGSTGTLNVYVSGKSI